MKKLFRNVMLATAGLLTLFSCSKEENDRYENVTESTTGVYILNSGIMDSNNSELTIYYPSSGTVVTNAFASANNGKRMGDSANDMLVYGSKLYIAVTGSAVVFVTDLNGKILQEVTIKGENANLCPKQMTAAKGKVYVTYKEGYVASIDTVSFQTNKAKVGPSPEGIVYSDARQRLYVAISNSYNYPDLYNKVQMLDPHTLETIGELEVGYNPQNFHVLNDETIYLVSWGDYGANPAALHKINTRTDEVITIDGVRPTHMTLGSKEAYLLCSEYDENWNQTIRYYVYDFNSDAITGELVSSDLVPNGHSIYADNTEDLVYIGSSDYVNNGDMYVVKPQIFSADASVEIIKKFDTGAINPYKVCFVNSQNN